MRLRLASLRSSRLLAVPAVVMVSIAGLSATARAELREIGLRDLAINSDSIVVATVTNVEAGVLVRNLEDGSLLTMTVATARVLETWKGERVGEVSYRASPTWPCDLSHAEKRERVVLFLEKG